MALTQARSAPAGSAIAREIARDELDALSQPCCRQTPPCHRNDMRQVEKRGPGRGTGAQESNGPSARSPANVQQMLEPEWPDCPDDLAGVGR